MIEEDIHHPPQVWHTNVCMHTHKVQDMMAYICNLTLGRARQENCEWEASLGYIKKLAGRREKQNVQSPHQPTESKASFLNSAPAEPCADSSRGRMTSFITAHVSTDSFVSCVCPAWFSKQASLVKLGRFLVFQPLAKLSY